MATWTAAGTPDGKIQVPSSCLLVLMGASGSGKSTLARKHFRPTEILSSDSFRALVSDDENDQSATDDAFRALYCIAEKRLARGRLTVIDATNVRPADRRGFVVLAEQFKRPLIAVVLNLPASVCLERNQSRSDRCLNPEVLSQQVDFLRSHLSELTSEGFDRVYVLSTIEEVGALEFMPA